MVIFFEELERVMENRKNSIILFNVQLDTDQADGRIGSSKMTIKMGEKYGKKIYVSFRTNQRRQRLEKGR